MGAGRSRVVPAEPGPASLVKVFWDIENCSLRKAPGSAEDDAGVAVRHLLAVLRDALAGLGVPSPARVDAAVYHNPVMAARKWALARHRVGELIRNGVRVVDTGPKAGSADRLLSRDVAGVLQEEAAFGLRVDTYVVISSDSDFVDLYGDILSGARPRRDGSRSGGSERRRRGGKSDEGEGARRPPPRLIVIYAEGQAAAEITELGARWAPGACATLSWNELKAAAAARGPDPEGSGSGGAGGTGGGSSSSGGSGASPPATPPSPGRGPLEEEDEAPPTPLLPPLVAEGLSTTAEEAVVVEDAGGMPRPPPDQTVPVGAAQQLAAVEAPAGQGSKKRGRSRPPKPPSQQQQQKSASPAPPGALASPPDVADTGAATPEAGKRGRSRGGRSRGRSRSRGGRGGARGGSASDDTPATPEADLSEEAR